MIRLTALIFFFFGFSFCFVAGATDLSRGLFQQNLLASSWTAQVPPITSFDERKINQNQGGQQLFAQRKSSSKKKVRRYRRRIDRNRLSEALRKLRQGNYRGAADLLYRLRKSSVYSQRKYEIKYLLGRTFYKAGLLQTASFHFIAVAQHGSNKYVQKSLGQLSLAANSLGDDTALDYALSKVNVNKFPKSQRSMLYFRIGELQLRQKDYRGAVKSFARVSQKSPWYSKAKYLDGLAYSLLKDHPKAIRSFDRLLSARSNSPITDESRIAAVLGKARVYYQAKEWASAIKYYNQVPRDSEAWRESLFESSWAMLRSGRFRSAISAFQTIHSPFYENFYQPESLILRSIVYLYICQYQEMEKTLTLFNKIYIPVHKNIKSYLKRYRRPSFYFTHFSKFLIDYSSGVSLVDKDYKLPVMVFQYIAQKGDIKRSYEYINKLNQERRRMNAWGRRWLRSSLGKKSLRDLNRRTIRARNKIGTQVRQYLRGMLSELTDTFEQEGFARFEMLNAKRQDLKKKVADQSNLDVYAELNRSRYFYIKNGYEYWPFQGEYWLDELGNYHYAGTQSCR